MVMMLALFYFMLWRPQAQKQKETAAMLAALKKGDEVVTSGGLIGRIYALTESHITLEVGEKDRIRIKVLRSHVTGPASAAPAATGSSPEAAAKPADAAK